MRRYNYIVIAIAAVAAVFAIYFLETDKKCKQGMLSDKGSIVVSPPSDCIIDETYRETVPEPTRRIYSESQLFDEAEGELLDGTLTDALKLLDSNIDEFGFSVVSEFIQSLDNNNQILRSLSRDVTPFGIELAALLTEVDRGEIAPLERLRSLLRGHGIFGYRTYVLLLLKMRRNFF